jgi:hypothetical protein
MDKQRDWRLTNQEKYLKNVELKYSAYDKVGEHDHCEFCMAKFSEQNEDLHEGYCMIDEYRWICTQCFEDFKDLFHWKVIN